MICKNCGANYKLRELRCPYCGTENGLGRIWLMRRNETIKRFEAEKREAKQRFVPYVVSKLVNRLILLFAICCIVMVGVLIHAAVRKYGGSASADAKKKAMALYEDDEFYELHEYMSDNNLYGKVPDYVTQAAALAYDYNEFLTFRMIYVPENPGDWEEDDIKFILGKTMNLYTHNEGIYDAEFEENQELYEVYRKRLRAFWMGTLRCSEEEVEFLADEDSQYEPEEMKNLCSEILERGAAYAE